MQANNGNGQAIDPTQSVAGLERGIGLLWNKVDEFQAATKDNAATINQKLETWITTNHSIQESTQSLLQAIVALMNEIRASAESSEKGNQFLAQLSEQLPQLQAAIDSMPNILQSLSETSMRSEEEAIEAQMRESEETLSAQLAEIAIDLTTKIEKLKLPETQSTSAPSQTIEIPYGLKLRLERVETRIGAALYHVENLSEALIPKTQKTEDADEPASQTASYKARKRLQQVVLLFRKRPWSCLGSVAVASLILAVAVNQGRSQVVSQFGGQSNLDSWQQIQEWNQKRLTDCQQQLKEECVLKIPPADPSTYRLRLVPKG
ncbi:hypothetical protein H6F67_00210 [Microcoleus sp. FACHB-1515]|uniref:hypothetical protein n=1 Tax=Cyanophyceae TaxID=3028117 RepID=UPI0016877CDD|nr:hypothetical protein [Microcoleus sp. FACHB-1515]MBD2088298.1 hypothetical protein [Microcoleus sp. FACHB-1515]